MLQRQAAESAKKLKTPTIINAFKRVSERQKQASLRTSPDQDDFLGTKCRWVVGGEDVVQHFEEVIGLFKALHPGRHIVFVFDNSSTHGCWPEDGSRRKQTESQTRREPETTG